MNAYEKTIFYRGVDSVLDELLECVAELERTRNNPKSSYCKGQLYILRRIMEEMFCD